ncbi:D-alanyl-D-alanine carboxypeptidase (penicillin-binding protein 5/6) [Cohnella sp. OV330]|uniref:D-alanyl-D-alanine carboxypeptidase family protein n=1 Tax=Cohnella sp. OV330 TaxID=1855288 RepID=UPI0008E2E642|nr:D-alanyl-D-alanine carboxypeptidase family protein [Cohnella sp. OV330]SFB44174.1 D-alanyl-D-alanine carboxypeptidase (penicillin-binding protein 5/6) [Cohnella sp. OV330]
MRQLSRRTGRAWIAMTTMFLAWGGYASAAVPADASAPPSAQSEAAILVEQHTGNVLYVKHGDERLYPASITKIATAIIALEQSSMSDIATVSKTARGEEGTRVYLAEGERVTMEKLLYGMMLNSGNDAATAIAEQIDGTKDKFAERMNAFMRDTIGAYDSNFVNPSGLPDPNQYTTASDMAMLARYAMDNETFRQIVSTRKLPWSGLEWTSTLENHNKMLTDYPGATGIKNGYTIAAGNTLVGSAERDGMSLIGVVLKAGSKNIAYADMAAMLDYGFANFGVRMLFAEGERYKLQDEAGDAREWIADKAIWGVYPKNASPVLKVDMSGQVVLESERGTFFAGELSPVKKEVAISAFSGQAEAEGMQAENTAAESSKSPIPVYALGAGVLLAASAAAMARRRARRARYPFMRPYDRD